MRSSTSRYPAEWRASSESGVLPSMGRSPVSRITARYSAGGRSRELTDPVADTRADTMAKLGDLAASAGPPPHPHAGLARPRRRRGGRFRAARRPRSPGCGPRPASRSRCARRTRRATRRRASATATAYPQGRPLPRVPRGASSARRPAGTGRATGSSRSGTACRSARRCGPPGPRVVFLHHVHGAMWRMVLPPRTSRSSARLLEKRIAPPIYRRSRIITLSESSRDELIHELDFEPIARLGRAARASTRASRPATRPPRSPRRRSSSPSGG